MNNQNKKTPNVYQLVIELSYNQQYVRYFSAQHKVYYHLEKYTEDVFEEVCEVDMFNQPLEEETINGYLIDYGEIVTLESNLKFPVKIYRLKIL